jgi:hypothetical protein
LRAASAGLQCPQRASRTRPAPIGQGRGQYDTRKCLKKSTIWQLPSFSIWPHSATLTLGTCLRRC